MLQSEHIYLRALEPSDVEVLYVWENDTEVWKVSHTLTPFSKHVLQQFVDGPQDIYTARQLRLMICLKEEEQAIGTVDFFDFEPFHQRVGLGILIADEANRGKGHAHAALELIIEYAFTFLPIQQLFCNIMASNEKSIRLFEKHGFECVGTKKNWIRTGQDTWEDEHLYQLQRKSRFYAEKRKTT